MTRTANQLNGFATAVADGNDYYTLPSALYPITNANNTIFLVANCTNEAAVRYFLVMTGVGTATRYFLRSETTSGQVSFTNSAASGNRVAVTVTKSNYNIFATRFAATNLQRMSANNSAYQGNSVGAKGESIAGTIGAYTTLGAYLIGGIAEMAIFNWAFTDKEIELLNGYFSFKWGITIS
jgi:hypothetical protein